MKTKRSFIVCLLIAITLISVAAFGQVPNLGTASGFLFFTSVGAVGNTGPSVMTGDAGSNAGEITGMGQLNGNVYTANTITAQAATDVLAAYNEIINTPSTGSHSATLGNNEIITAGVYYTLAAASINGTLVLDAQSNPNAIFIFKIGGALTIAASATISLINSASAANIFWVTEGAVSIGAMTSTSGTFLAHNGALDIGDGSVLQGRLLSTAGAVNIMNSTAFIPSPVLLALLSDRLSGRCAGGDMQFNWTSFEFENITFSIQGSIDGLLWKELGIGKSTFQNSLLRQYRLTYRPVNNSLVFYRLVQTGIAGFKKYGNTIRLQPCAIAFNEQMVLYPNPSYGQFRILVPRGSNEVYHIAVFNAQGKRIFTYKGIPAGFDLSHHPPGLYEVWIQTNSFSSVHKIVLRDK